MSHPQAGGRGVNTSSLAGVKPVATLLEGGAFYRNCDARRQPGTVPPGILPGNARPAWVLGRFACGAMPQKNGRPEAALCYCRRRTRIQAAAAAILIPASAASACALSVFSQVNSGSSRPKWP